MAPIELNGPRQPTAGSGVVQPSTAYPRVPSGASPAATAAAGMPKKRRHSSSQFPYDCHVSFSAEAGHALQRLAKRRGLRMSETQHIRHAVDLYLANQDVAFRQWLEGGNG